MKQNEKIYKFSVGFVKIKALSKMKKQLALSQHFNKWTLMTRKMVINFFKNY